jgi:hypothetical protein
MRPYPLPFPTPAPTGSLVQLCGLSLFLQIAQTNDPVAHRVMWNEGGGAALLAAIDSLVLALRGSDKGRGAPGSGGGAGSGPKRRPAQKAAASGSSGAWRTPVRCRVCALCGCWCGCVRGLVCAGSLVALGSRPPTPPPSADWSGGHDLLVAGYAPRPF